MAIEFQSPAAEPQNVMLKALQQRLRGRGGAPQSPGVQLQPPAADPWRGLGFLGDAMGRSFEAGTLPRWRCPIQTPV